MDERFDGRSAALERQVQTHLTRGHRYFFQSRCQQALEAYQTAYSLIHRFLHPDFPYAVFTTQISILRDLKIFDVLLAAAGEVARFRDVAGDKLLIVSPVDPSREVNDLVTRFGTAGTTAPPTPAQNYYHLATSYLHLRSG